MASIQASLFDGKVCRRCGIWKPARSFRKNKKCIDGREPCCRPCYDGPEAKEQKRRSDRAYYASHRDAILEYQKRYAAEHAAQLRASARQYREQHAEELREQKKQYAAKKLLDLGEAYRQQQRERSKAYRDNPANKPGLVERCHRARARRLQAEGTWTKAEWEALLDHYGRHCARCGKTGVTLHRDHVIPLARGGRNDIMNLQPLCHSCNSRKHTDISDYRPDKGAWLAGNFRGEPFIPGMDAAARVGR